MIRRFLARLVAGRASVRPRRECGCHPAYHDLGVHAPGHCGAQP